MAFDRRVDAPLDEKDPCTRSRAIPSGQLSSTFVALLRVATKSSDGRIGAACAWNPVRMLSHQEVYPISSPGSWSGSGAFRRSSMSATAQMTTL